VRRLSGGEPFVASPPQLRKPASKRRPGELTEHTTEAITAMFPQLDETTLLAYAQGPGNRFAAGDTSACGGGPVKTMNPSESWMIALLTRLDIAFEYEAHRFALTSERHSLGREVFTPDLYIPELGLHVELTVGEEWWVRQKRWRIYAMRDQHPHTMVTLMQAEDFLDLAAGEVTREAVLDYLANRTLIARGVRAKVYSHGWDPTVHPKRRLYAPLPWEIHEQMIAQVPAVVHEPAIV
jgi:hypothetical protein